MKSGVKLLINDLKNSKDKIRILTESYLNITQSEAIYLLKTELEENLDIRFYSNPSKSFHPKSYMFHNENDTEIYIGSLNMSKRALTTSIEWNYHFIKSKNAFDFNNFQNAFEDLFQDAILITDEILKQYSKSWIKPKFTQLKDNEKESKEF